MKLIALAAMVGSLISIQAHAKSDHPTTGAVYNTKEASYIWYDCTLSSPSTLECGFTYSSVRKKADPKDWARDLAKIEENFAAIKEDWERGVNEAAKLCAAMEKGEKIYSDKLSLPPDKMKILSEVPEGQKTDIRKFLSAVNQLCRNFSKSNMIEFARTQHKKDSRTCKIYSSFDRQKFTRHGENEWVSVQENYGICRSVTVERFERAKEDMVTMIYTNRLRVLLIDRISIVRRFGTFSLSD